MKPQGWISLHRKIKDHWLYKRADPFTQFEAWIDILLSANHKQRKMPIGVTLYIIEPGEQIRSMRKLSTEWKWSIGKVKRFLKMLEEDGMIKVTNDTKTTRISVCNWEAYQDTRNTLETQTEHVRNTNGTHMEHERNTNGNQTETNNNVNNANNENNGNNENKRGREGVSVSDSDSTNKSAFHEDLVAAMKSIPVPAEIDSAQFRTKIFAFNLMWCDRDKRLPAIQTIEQQYRKLIELQDQGDDVVKVIEYAIEGGNRRFFPLPESKKESGAESKLIGNHDYIPGDPFGILTDLKRRAELERQQSQAKHAEK